MVFLDFLKKATPFIAPGLAPLSFLADRDKRNQAVDLAREAVVKPYATYGQSFAEARQRELNLVRRAKGQPEQEVKQSFTPDTAAARLLLGDKPIESVQKRREGYESTVGESRFKQFSTPLSFLGAGALVGSDVLGGGGKSTVGKEVLEKLAKESTEQGVKAIAKNLGQELGDDAVKAIASTKDRNVISNLLGQPTALPRPDITPPIPTTPVTEAVEAVGKGTDPVRNVIDALGGLPAKAGESPVAGIKNLQGKQKTLYSVERSARLGKSKAAAGGLSGREATKAELGALKGQLPKVDATALIDHLKTKVSPEDIDGILDTLRTSENLSGYEPITAQSAIVNLFDNGKLPTPSELKILEKSLGSDFIETIGQTASLYDKGANVVTEVFGAPRAIMASYDISGMGRQGAVLGARFPKEFKDAFGKQVQYFGSEKAFNEGMQAIQKDPLFELANKAKIALTGAGGGPEEAFLSTLPEKVPVVGKGIEASNRSYTGALTHLRFNAFKRIASDLEQAGKHIGDLSEKELRSIGEYINTASGRGGKLGGYLDKHAETLSQGLFSPRLWASRLKTLSPKYYYDLKGPARKYALQSAGNFAAVAASILGLAVAAGAEVETDARSSDFLKIKVGDTRYDILGGFQQNLVFAHRQLTGEKKNSTTGEVSELGSEFGGDDRLTILTDLIENKANPVLATGSRLLRGKDRAGQPVNPVSEVANLFVPLAAKDTYEQVKKYGPVGAARALPGFVGAGSQTYGTEDMGISDKQKASIKILEKQGAPKEQLAATKLFYQTLKTTPDRRKASKQINDAIAEGNTAKAQQIATDYNKRYAEAFKDWVKEYGQYAEDETLAKEYNSGKLNLSTSSIRTRQRNINNNPLYSATLGER